MYLLILYLPLMSSFWSMFLGRYLGKKGSSLITLSCIFLAWILTFVPLYEILVSNGVCLIQLFKWIDVGLFNLHWEFLFDALTSIMLFVVLSISLCVHIYSIEYMWYDPHLSRFLSYLSLFTFFMLILITAGNFLQLFIGWEGVGLCSYLLINFWYTRIAANKAAMKALIINKIGDVAFLLGIILLFIFYNSLDFALINCISWLIQKSIYFNTFLLWINIDYFSIVLVLFIIGACAKSAQIGLHTWLPDAMEGPTPVSALIHAATMVTAGVFLLLRSVHLLKYDENSLLLISFLGSITAFVAATIGLFQNDIKKIIAYSTCSQLGYMVLSCGLNNYSGSLFHLMNHAFFKALLFLSAGAIIHSMLNQQDIRRMGMLLRYLPLSYIMILIGSLTIMGIPFLTGYYSKDFIIEYIYSSKIFLNFFLYWLGIISAFLTSFYSIKLLYLTFFNHYNNYLGLVYKKVNVKLKDIVTFRMINIMQIVAWFRYEWIKFLDIADLRSILKNQNKLILKTLESAPKPKFSWDFLSFKKKTPIFISTYKTIINESNHLVTLALIILGCGSVFIGFLFKDLFIGMGTDIWVNTLYTESYKDNLRLIEVEFLSIEIKMIPIMFTLISSCLSYLFFKYYLFYIQYFFNYILFFKKIFFKSSKIFFEFNQYLIIILNIRKFFNRAYYFNEIYNFYLSKNRNFSDILFKNLDKGIVEYITMLVVRVIGWFLVFCSKQNKIKMDTLVFFIIYGVYSIIIFIVIYDLFYNYKVLLIICLLIFFELFWFLQL